MGSCKSKQPVSHPGPPHKKYASWFQIHAAKNTLDESIMEQVTTIEINANLVRIL